MIYVASPYSHPHFAVTEMRYREVMCYTAKLINEGLIAFSPIVYAHEMARLHQLPTDAAWWENFNNSFLSISNELHVYLMDGWKESKGVAMEIAFAESIGIPIVYVQEMSE